MRRRDEYHPRRKSHITLRHEHAFAFEVGLIAMIITLLKLATDFFAMTYEESVYQIIRFALDRHFIASIQVRTSWMAGGWRVELGR